MTIYVSPSERDENGREISRKKVVSRKLMVPANFEILKIEMTKYANDLVFAIDDELVTGNELWDHIYGNKARIIKKAGSAVDIEVGKAALVESMMDPLPNVVNDGFHTYEDFEYGFVSARELDIHLGIIQSVGLKGYQQACETYQINGMRVTISATSSTSVLVLRDDMVDVIKTKEKMSVLRKLFRDLELSSPLQMLSGDETHFLEVKKETRSSVLLVNKQGFVSGFLDVAQICGGKDFESRSKTMMSFENKHIITSAEVVSILDNSQAGCIALLAPPFSGKTRMANFLSKELNATKILFKEPGSLTDRLSTLNFLANCAPRVVIVDSIREELYAKGAGGAGVKGVNNDLFITLRRLNDAAILSGHLIIVVLNPMMLSGVDLKNFINSVEGSCNGVILPYTFEGRNPTFRDHSIASIRFNSIDNTSDERLRIYPGSSLSGSFVDRGADMVTRNDEVPIAAFVSDLEKVGLVDRDTASNIIEEVARNFTKSTISKREAQLLVNQLAESDSSIIEIEVLNYFNKTS